MLNCFVLFCLTFASDWTGASVVGQVGDQGAGAPVLARVVPAGVVRDGDLAKGLGVADGADALEGGTPCSGEDDVARPAVLALLSPGLARVGILAILADVIIGAPRTS